MNNPLHSSASAMLACGLSVIPAKNKSPAIAAWKPYQTARMKESDVPLHFNGSPQVAIICGAVSGNLEVIDVDLKHDSTGTLMGDLSHLISNSDEALWNRLAMQKTTSGGVHILYRCETIAGNQKLAKRADNNEVLIETRGEGGYIIAAPSPGYMLFSGHSFAAIPVITPDERELLLAACRSFTQVTAAATQPSHKPSAADWAISPGDDFDARGDVLETLCGHGWSVVMRRGEKAWLKRPGTTDAAHSATWNVIPGRFWCWSTSTQFESETVYKPYAVYAMLAHGGDYQAAAKSLLASGYGKPAEQVPFEPPTPGERKADAPDLKQVQKWILEDERGLALLFSSLRGHEYVYDNTYKHWRQYKGGVWQLDKENRLYGRFADYLKPSVLAVANKLTKQILESDGNKKEKFEAQQKQVMAAGKSLNNAMPVQRVLSLCRSFLSVTTDTLDNDPLLFNMRNGTYDFADATFRPHEPKELISKKSPHFYSADATCPQWDDFLETIFQKDKELISFVRRVVGYSLTGLSDMQALLFCHGGGGNGKSVFFSVLSSLIGDYYTNIPIDLLLAKDKSGSDEYQLANLRGARCVVASEIPSGKRLNESQVKDMTGSDMINARVPYGMPFSFLPSHTLWMFGNHKPVISGTDMGIWRRMHLIPFLYCVPPEKRKDTSIMMKGFEDEMPGIFNWAAEGYREYLQNGLNPPEIVRAATEEYKQDSNNFGQFLLEKCMKNTGNTTSKILFKSYSDWCADQSERPKFANARQMNDFLRSTGFVVKPGTDNKTEVFGLMIMPDSQEVKEHGIR